MDELFPSPGVLVQCVRDPFFGVRNQVFILVHDSASLKAPRFVKSIQEGRKNGFVSCCGTIIYFERRFGRILVESNEIALLMTHARSSYL